MTQIDVIGIGASTVDILSLVEHLPAEDENMRALEISVQGGGPVATAMVTLARLGASTAMVDAIGDDWRGTRIREEFQQEGVDVSYLKVGKGWTSPTSCILVKKDNGARSIVWSPGSAPELSAADVDAAMIESAKILHVNGRHWGACMEAVRIARAADVKVSFDGGANRYRAELNQLVPLTDICIVARDFAEKYTRETDTGKAAEMLLRKGPRLVVITEGTKGSWVYSREGRSFHQRAYLLPDVVDTTGCGDSYHGAFLFGLIRGLDLEKTASLASAVAALNTQRLGGRAGLPTYEEADAFLAARLKPQRN
ncbi:MAG: carbohydrate kinase family protein [Anaerolineales bacterium]